MMTISIKLHTISNLNVFHKAFPTQLTILINSSDIEHFLQTNAELQLKLEFSTGECESLRSAESSSSRNSSWDSAFTMDKAIAQVQGPFLQSASSSSSSPSSLSNMLKSLQLNSPSSTQRSLVKGALSNLHGGSSISERTLGKSNGESSGYHTKGIEIKDRCGRDKNKFEGRDGTENINSARENRGNEKLRSFFAGDAHGRDRENKDIGDRGREILASRQSKRENLLKSEANKCRDYDREEVGGSFDYDVFPALMLTECERVEVGRDRILSPSITSNPSNDKELIVATRTQADISGTTYSSEGEVRTLEEGQQQGRGSGSYPGPQKVKKTPKLLWGEYLDPASGLYYYHNRSTKETKWERPSEASMKLLLTDLL